MKTLINNVIKAYENENVCMVLTKGEELTIPEEIVVEKGSKLKLTIINKIDEQKLENKIAIKQEEDSELELVVIYLGKGHLKDAINIYLEGDGAKCKLHSAYVIDDQTEYEMNYEIYHKGKRTVSDVIVKGALLGEAKKRFIGNLYFERGTKGSNGSEVEEALLLSSKARSYGIPALWCYEEDIVGNHAASSGKLSKDKLFYLMSRGLSEEEAKYLMVEAAISPILDQVEDITLKEELHEEVSRRMAK